MIFYRDGEKYRLSERGVLSRWVGYTYGHWSPIRGLEERKKILNDDQSASYMGGISRSLYPGHKSNASGDRDLQVPDRRVNDDRNE